jgi:histidine transport system substrate-binding protein
MTSRPQGQNRRLRARHHPGSLRQGRTGQGRGENQAYANQDQVYADLTSGRLDASIQDMLQAELGFLKSPNGADYEVSKPVDSELLPAKTAVGIKKGNTELKALLDKGIKALHDDGTYATIQKKHFGDLNLYSGK